MLPTFLAALGVVFTMLLFAVPGFMLVKTKLVKEGSISAFARLLMYIASPCLLFDSVTRNAYEPKLLWMLVISFVFAAVILLAGMLIFMLVFKKKSSDEKYRIYNLATTRPNCAFMGVPVLEALLPDYPYAVAFSAMFSLAMNIVSWSLGAYIISQDKKNMSARRILLNPAMIALVIALPFFFSGISLPASIYNAVTLLAKMTTPLCMLIMGMRLACVSLKGVFLTPGNYLIVAIRQILFPLAVFLILLVLPLDSGMKSSIYIITACPVASVVLSHAEMIGKGQKHAAYLVLLGTSLSIVTIPIMSLLLKFF